MILSLYFFYAKWTKGDIIKIIIKNPITLEEWIQHETISFFVFIYG